MAIHIFSSPDENWIPGLLGLVACLDVIGAS